MDEVALLPPKDRAALFGETGAARGVTDTIIEKDFWVCWTLKRLFALQGDEFATLVFKGGTSLSKAYGAIRRFSEDIDLSFDRADLGYTGERDPKKEGLSKKKAGPTHRGPRGRRRAPHRREAAPSAPTRNRAPTGRSQGRRMVFGDRSS